MEVEYYSKPPRSSEEEDELGQSVKKFKENLGARQFSQPHVPISYKGNLVGEIPGAYEQAFKFEKSSEEEYELDVDIEPLIEGMVKVKLSKETKLRIREPWSKALIVKVFSRTVGFNYLTFKLNALWKPFARMDCVNLRKDYFLIRFSSMEGYDKVLRGGPWFVGENFLAIRPWEPYYKASKAKLSSVAVWVRLPGGSAQRNRQSNWAGHKQEQCCYKVKLTTNSGEEGESSHHEEGAQEEQMDGNFGPWMSIDLTHHKPGEEEYDLGSNMALDAPVTDTMGTSFQDSNQILPQANNQWWKFLMDVPLISWEEVERLSKQQRPSVIPHFDESRWLIQEKRLVDFRGTTSTHLGNHLTLKLIQILEPVQKCDILIYCKKETLCILKYVMVWKPEWAMGKDLLQRMGWSMVKASMLNLRPVEVPLG
nr:hypothetical protein CFP56_23091 [Quercus suber]